MPTPAEHKTVQARFLEYAEAEGALVAQFSHLHSDIYGNREFVEHLHNPSKFLDSQGNLERE